MYTTPATHHTPLSCPSAGLLLTMVRWYFPAWRSLRTRSSSSTRAVNLHEEHPYSTIWREVNYMSKIRNRKSKNLGRFDLKGLRQPKVLG